MNTRKLHFSDVNISDIDFEDLHKKMLEYAVDGIFCSYDKSSDSYHVRGDDLHFMLSDIMNISGKKTGNIRQVLIETGVVKRTGFTQYGFTVYEIADLP